MALCAPYHKKSLEASDYQGQSKLNQLAEIVEFSPAELDERIKLLRFLVGGKDRKELGLDNPEAALKLWELVETIFLNTGEFEAARKLFLEKDFVTAHQGSLTARRLAVELVKFDLERKKKEPAVIGPRAVEFALEWDLRGQESFTPDILKDLLEEASTRQMSLEAALLINRYSSEEERDFLIKEEVKKHFSESRLESGDLILKRTNIQFESTDYEEVLERLSQNRREFLAAGDISAALGIVNRETLLKHYQAHGLDLDRFPEVTVPDQYHGKILTLKLGDRVFIRSQASMHKIIFANFRMELAGYGYDLSARAVKHAGGAWLKFTSTSTILINQRSEDYGECDKALAAEVVKRAFPDYKVTHQPY